MSTHTTETEDRTQYEELEGGERGSRVRRAAGALGRSDRLGTAAMLGGGALIVRSLRSEGGTRSGLQGLAGGGLLLLGLLDRLVLDAGPDVEDRSGSRTESEDVNPRGTSDEPDVEDQTPPGEGHIQFTEHQEGDDAKQKPHLDDEDGNYDPRLHDEDEGEDVTVDLSEAHMADEASEAAGPTEEQSLPTQVDDTEPDASPDEDESHLEADTPGAGDDSDAGGGEGEELGGDGGEEIGDGGDEHPLDDAEESEVANPDDLDDPSEMDLPDVDEGETDVGDEDGSEIDVGDDEQSEVAHPDDLDESEIDVGEEDADEDGRPGDESDSE